MTMLEMAPEAHEDDHTLRAKKVVSYWASSTAGSLDASTFVVPIFHAWGTSAHASALLPLKVDEHHDAESQVEDAVRLLSDAEARLEKALQKYADAAIARADVRQVDPGVWFASVPALRGVYGDADSREAALELLHEAVMAWATITLEKSAHLPSLSDAAEVGRG